MGGLQSVYNYRVTHDMSSSDGVVIPKVLIYSVEPAATITPLVIVNGSPQAYVFKIRTNQRTALSLHSSHGFLRPYTQLEIAVKIIERPNPAIPLKLEVNYAPASEEEIEANDSKSAVAGKVDLAKRVVVLREAKKGGGGGALESERVVSNEEESVLDSSTKKEESENIFNTTEVNPFTTPVIRAPKVLEPLQADPDVREEGLGGLFKHTFSIDTPMEGVASVPLMFSEQEVRMNIFQAAVMAEKSEDPSPPPSTREQSYNPFDALIQSVKNESGITIKNAIAGKKQEVVSRSSPSPPKEQETFNPFSVLIQSVKNESGITIKSNHVEDKQEVASRFSPPPKEEEAFNPFSVLIQSVKNESGITIQQPHIAKKQGIVSPSSPPAEQKQEEPFNPFAFLVPGVRKQHSFAPKQQQPAVKANRLPFPLRSSLQKRPPVESNIIQDDDEALRVLEKELHELEVRIQCQESFIYDLEGLPVTPIPKKYTKALFIVLSLVFFLLGGAARHYAL